MVSLPTYFFLTSEIKPEGLERADFYLSDQTKDDVPAAVALDLLLGAGRATIGRTIPPGNRRAAPGDGNLGRPAASAVGQPPLMFDNLNQIRSRYGESLAEYRAGQTKMLNTVTIASFFGGLGLVLLVAMLGLMRIVSGIHFWIPAVGAHHFLRDPWRHSPGLQPAGKRPRRGRGVLILSPDPQSRKSRRPDAPAG